MDRPTKAQAHRHWPVCRPWNPLRIQSKIHFHIHNEMNEGESVRVVPEEGKVKVEAEEGRNGYSRIL